MTYGVLPTEIDLNMTLNDYSFSIAILAIVCAGFFWYGFTSRF